LSVCRLKSIDGLCIEILDCDAIDGTPVLDIKPYVTAFGPKSKVTEPRWILDLMEDYWEKDKAQSADPALEVMIANAIKERQLENKDKALEILEHAQQRFPESPLVPYQIGCTHDALGKEADAVEPYKQAIALGLRGKDRLQLFIGLSSTLRSLGRYPEALAVIDQACEDSPQELVSKVFRSLVLNNLERGDEALGELLNVLLDSSTDCEVRAYARALQFYSTRLREVFE
jgi:tetratricopeptide (TPR) repeat protein